VIDDGRSDAEIIRSSLTDPAEFSGIFERHHSAVFRFIARRIGRQEAADLAADVFVKAFTLRNRYDLDRPSCLPWLFAIAGNVVGDRMRWLRRRDWSSLPSGRFHDSFVIADADDRLVAARVGRRLNEALGRLSDVDRETLLLFAFDGLSYSEVGRVLGIPPGTVGSRISRARHLILEAIPDLEQITSEVPTEEDGP